MGTALGPVMQYLMSGALTDGTTLASAIQATDSTLPVVLAFAWPNDPCDDMLCLGRADPFVSADAEVGTQAFQELGARTITEQFDIPFYIASGRGGDDQMAPFTAAVAIYDAFVKFVATDLTLGGAILNGRYAEITVTRSAATPTEDDAKAGRQYVITGQLTCKNKYETEA